MVLNLIPIGNLCPTHAVIRRYKLIIVALSGSDLGRQFCLWLSHIIFRAHSTQYY